MSAINSDDELWSVLMWGIQSEKPDGELPAQGFTPGGQILITGQPSASSRTLEWSDAEEKPCSMTLSTKVNRLEGNDVLVNFGGTKVKCAKVEVYTLSSADGSIQMLVGLLNQTHSGWIGTGNAGAFVAQAGPVTPSWKQRLARWILGR